MKKIILLFFILLFLNFNQVFAIVEYQEEIIELRTANRKIYDLGNNTYRYEYYSTPIHYFDKTEYIEYNQDLTYDSKTTKYTTEKSNYSVGLPNSNSDNTNITLNYYDLFHIEINYFGKASIIEDDINTKDNVYASYVSNQTNHFSVIPQNDRLNEVHSIISSKSNRQISFSTNSNELEITKKDGIYYFVDSANIAIFQLSNYYLLDSSGNISNKVTIEVSEIVGGGHEFSLNLDDEFLDDENTTYPVNVIGGITYSLIPQNNVISDKTIVKNTYEGYDGDILTVAKQKYYPFQNTPIYLPEYHSYSILELNFDELIGTNITVLDARLYLNRYQSNVNAKLPLSEITNSSYDLIDGFTTYNKTLISLPFVSSDTLLYDITDEVESHVNNTETSLLLELSPQFINLGASSIKYMNFISTNAAQYNSPYLTIDVYGDIISTYGDAPSYHSRDSEFLNCFAYALRQDTGIQKIYDDSDTLIQFSSIQITETYFYGVIIPSVMYTIQQEGYNVRLLTSGYADISTFEYRIAFRVGNIANTSGDNFFTVNEYGTIINPDVDDIPEDFHFMIQLNNGSWAGKQGTLPSVYYTMVFPSIMDWNAYTSQQFDEYFENFYDSSTIYFAISGGSYEW